MTWRGKDPIVQTRVLTRLVFCIRVESAIESAIGKIQSSRVGKVLSRAKSASRVGSSQNPNIDNKVFWNIPSLISIVFTHNYMHLCCSFKNSLCKLLVQRHKLLSKHISFHKNVILKLCFFINHFKYFNFNDKSSAHRLWF